jgi:hypothetical protein
MLLALLQDNICPKDRFFCAALPAESNIIKTTPDFQKEIRRVFSLLCLSEDASWYACFGISAFATVYALAPVAIAADCYIHEILCVHCP